MAQDDLDYTSAVPSDARILVTGGSGFIGSNVINAYRAAGVEVVNADAKEPRDKSAQAHWRRLDVTRREDVEQLVSDVMPTHIYHLGARTDLDGANLDDYAANVEGVANVMDAVRANVPDVGRIVVASSRMVCRIGYEPKTDVDYCPPNAYGESKVRTEQVVRDVDDLPWVLVRPTSIWGPWFDVPYRDFFLSIAKGRYVHPRGRRIPKNFGYVGNTVWQLHHLMFAPADRVLGRTFYLADPAIDVRDFADRISAALGTRRAPDVPLPMLTAMAKAGDGLERVGRRAPLTSFRLSNLLTPMRFDLTGLEAVTGQAPIALDESVPATVAWMRQERLIAG